MTLRIVVAVVAVVATHHHNVITTRCNMNTMAKVQSRAAAIASGVRGCVVVEIDRIPLHAYNCPKGTLEHLHSASQHGNYDCMRRNMACNRSSAAPDENNMRAAPV